MMTPEEKEQLRQELKASSGDMGKVVTEIAESEEFKRKAAEATKAVFAILEPLLVAAATAGGGPAAGALAKVAGGAISNGLEKLATKKAV